MQFYVVKSRIFGPCYFGRRPATIKGKDSGNHGFTSTSEYCPIKVILRNDKLLWQIPGAFIELASTTVSITATEDTLALGRGRENNLQSSEETVVITPHPGAL